MPAEIQKKLDARADVRRTWAIAMAIMVVTVLAIESFQHRSLLGLHIIWLHSLADCVLGAITFAAILYYRKWRQEAKLLQETLDRLRASEQLREDMSAMLIHDLKNPLVAGTMALQAVLRRQEASAVLSEAELGFLRVARDSQVRLGAMIGDLLTIAQAEGHEMTLGREPTSLAELVEEAVQEVSAATGQAGVTVVQRLDDLPRLTIDRHKIRRVLDNLLANAIKFTPSGGTIEISGETSEAEVHLTVSDTGPGIAPEYLDHIFEKFRQVGATQRMSIGIGLTFCKLVTEAHGGSIRAESQVGQGSRFIVSLPRTSGG